MFKKPYKTQQQNLLKSSDKRKLRDNLLRNFSAIKEDELNVVLPIKEDITQQKVSGTHTLLYTIGNNPLFFDVDGRGDFFPTLYTLWKLPHIVPSLTIHGPVAKYVLGGADLMLPGVILPEGGIDALGEIFLGDKASICIKGVNAPIAIGTMATSSKDMKKNGMKGRGIKVLHYLKDQLWANGTKEIPEILLVGPSAEEPETEEGGAAEGAPAVSDEVSTPLSEMSIKDNTDASATTTTTTSTNTETTPSSATPEATTTTATPATPSEQAPAAPDMDMDKLLELCFLGALHNTKDKELPILVSTFYSSKMLPNRPPGSIVDVKKSTYKKISEFLSAMEKQSLVQTKNMNDVLHLTEIFRGHPLYKEYKGVAAATKVEAPKEGQADNIEVVELFGIPAGIATVFGNPTKDQLFTHDEVNEALWNYVKEKNLDHSDEKQKSTTITLDPLLSEFVKKKDYAFPKQEFVPLVKSKLKPYFAISRNGETTITKGEVKKIQVLAEQRQGRFVTKISGLEAFGINLDELTKEWQHLFATSTSTQPGLGKGAGNVIVIQGNLLKEATKQLLTKYKIPKKYFEEQDKTKKSKK